MKLRKAGIFAAVCVCSASLLTGCSFSDVKNKLVGGAKKVSEAATDVNTTSIDPSTIKTVDESVEKPTFTYDLAGKTEVGFGAVFVLSSEATVSNGTVTYQWYVNNVNSNGGGTPIDGATDLMYQVDSSTPSHRFYYCVATNEVDGKINISTSSIHEVIVWDIGTWQMDEETGEYRYVLVDGTYPTSTWFRAEDATYYVDENGYRADGIATIGDNTFYFTDDGQLQCNATTPDGRVTNEYGIIQSDGSESAEAPAEVSAEVPAEESAPAEETSAEEAPAETTSEESAE